MNNYRVEIQAQRKKLVDTPKAALVESNGQHPYGAIKPIYSVTT
jgi:hypothetical protein